ncbi:MAG TPA: hypothetical protein VMV69_03590 [Pirellulales bacterium]|nr:hypothetical protein [Pirellulales bacterium]
MKTWQGNSETAGLAVLRPGWTESDARLTVDYGQRQLRTELIRGRALLWSGNWQPEVRLDGELLEPTSRWNNVCWVSDDDADYLELEQKLSGPARLQRHVLLARQDRFLFVADAVLCKRPKAIAYRGPTPLTAGVGFSAAGETHEGFLASRSGRRRHALVLPLALPEWRGAGPRGDGLAVRDGTLELRQSATAARALFAPLFIDLAARRIARPSTWRRLTVAQDRQTTSADVAVGYRAQVGARQWLFYRSLGPRGSRTLLGHHLVTEFLAARFSRAGQVEPIMEIE